MNRYIVTDLELENGKSEEEILKEKGAPILDDLTLDPEYESKRYRLRCMAQWNFEFRRKDERKANRSSGYDKAR